MSGSHIERLKQDRANRMLLRMQNYIHRAEESRRACEQSRRQLEQAVAGLQLTKWCLIVASVLLAITAVVLLAGETIWK